jgi:hypothetical protein
MTDQNGNALAAPERLNDWASCRMGGIWHRLRPLAAGQAG